MLFLIQTFKRRYGTPQNTQKQSIERKTERHGERERPGGEEMAGPTLRLSPSFSFSFLIVFVTLLCISDGAIPVNLEPVYPDYCRFSKGSVKLYNCKEKNKSPLGYVNLENYTSPER